jgi:hypothetical protein
VLEIDAEFEQGAAAERLVLPSRVRTDRTWLMAERLAAVLRRQGFIVRVHFLVRWLERARAFGVRLDPATFRRQFLQARHYRQTRPGYRNRIAVVAGMPVLYRMGGPRGRPVVLLGVLPGMPPVTRAPVPLLAPAREAEAALRFDSPEIRTVCEPARAYGYSVPAAFRPHSHPDRYRRRRDALNWLAGTARHWARRLGGLSAADIDPLVTCLVALERVIRPQGLVDDPPARGRRRGTATARALALSGGGSSRPGGRRPEVGGLQQEPDERLDALAQIGQVEAFVRSVRPVVGQGQPEQDNRGAEGPVQHADRRDGPSRAQEGRVRRCPAPAARAGPRRSWTRPPTRS